MKALFIWNELSINYIKTNYNDIKIVCNSEEINNINVNEFDSIVILVELDWNESFYHGYDLALEIIKKWNDDENPPNIIFCSFLTRLTLFDLNDNVNQFFAKSFKHYELPLEKAININDSYSTSKWLYLKKYALTTKGILDTIKHDIENSLKKNEVDYENIKLNFIRRINEISNIIDDSIKKCLLENHKNHKKHLQEILLLITNRIKNLNSLNKTESNYNGFKEDILLLEDDEFFLNEISLHLNKYFNVDRYTNGKEAIEAIEINGLNYRAVILDLELLEENSPLDQDVQGIEVYEFVKNTHPQIVRRILTGLPREGVKVLLDINQSDVLQKSQLAYLGYDDGFANWIKLLKTDISNYKSYRFMDGPSGGPWADNKKENTIGLKRSYHKLKVEDNPRFQKMWKSITNTVTKVIQNDPDIEISTEFKRIENNNKLTGVLDNEDIFNFLELLIIHRLVWLFYFEKDDIVIYKDVENKDLDMYHKYFWTDLTASPKSLFATLGLSLKGLGNQSLKKDASKIIFTFNSPKIFKEEYEFLKENKDFDSSKFSKLNETFKEVIFWVLDIISTNKSDFNKNYPKPPNNFFEITDITINTVLENLESENVTLNIPESKKNIQKMLIEDLDDFPNNFKEITIKIIDNFT